MDLLYADSPPVDGVNTAESLLQGEARLRIRVRMLCKGNLQRPCFRARIGSVVTSLMGPSISSPPPRVRVRVRVRVRHRPFQA